MYRFSVLVLGRGLTLQRSCAYVAMVAAVAVLSTLARVSVDAAHAAIPRVPGEQTLSTVHPRDYALSPSTTEPYAACPAPTPGHATCFAITVPPGAVERGTAEPLDLEGSGEQGGYSPADLQDAYDIPSTGGEGRTVAIVIAYKNAHIDSDLKEYRKAYGLPPCTEDSGCFRVVNQYGGATLPTTEAPPASWGIEADIDVEMVSAACPACHIVLVEANSSSFEDLFTAQDTAANLSGTTVVSDSWGGYEFPEEEGYDAHLNHPGIPTVVAAGDVASEAFYPATSSKAISVGGTNLTRDPGPRGWNESVWVSSSAGCSDYEAKPSWQSDWLCSTRTDNDVAAVGSTTTPVSIASAYYTASKGWGLQAGTSASAPIVAGIMAKTSASVRAEGAETFYRHDLYDVAEGSEGQCGGTYLCTATAGYDSPTGWGTPHGLPETQAPFGAVTQEPSQIEGTGATLHGYVEPAGSPTTYQFEYGQTTAYGGIVFGGEGNAGAGTLQRAGAKTVWELEKERIYHYRLVARNSSGTRYGADRTFATMPWSVTPVPKPKDASEDPKAKSSVTGVSCPSASYCLGVGVYATSPSGEAALVESWNGSAWAPQATLPSPPGGSSARANDVSCLSSTSCTTVGGYLTSGGQNAPLAERWNGSSWVAQPLPIVAGAFSTNYMTISCSSANSCMAVGTVNFKVGSTREPHALAARWTGSEWVLQTITAPAGASYEHLTGVSCPTTTSCFAVGDLTDPSGKPVALRWNGSEWTTLPIPLAVAPSSISCISSGVCVAVSPSFEAARWSGTKWVTSTLPHPDEQTYPGYGFNGAEITDVSCASSTTCVAVGSFSGPGGTTTLSERLNGAEWSVQNAPRRTNGVLRSVSCPVETACFGGGTKKEVGAEVDTVLAERADIPSSGPPIAATAYATKVTGEEAELGAYVNPNGFETSYHLEWGLKWGKYEHTLPEAPAGKFRTALRYGETISGLQPGTEYHYRVVATNEAGTSFGDDIAFTTAQWAQRQPASVPGAKWTAARDISCLSPSDCYAAGSYLASSGAKAAFAQHWDGTAWANQSVPAPSGAVWTALADVSCTSSSSCLAVGRYETAGKVEATLAERWNGSAWTIVATPNPAGAPSSWLERIACSSASACTAVGRYETSSKVEVTLAERWNGSEWSIQSTPSPAGAKWSRLAGVSCPGSTSCVAVGSYETSGGIRQTLAEVWNGTSWSVQLPANVAGSEWSSLKGIWCLSNNECVAVGSSRRSGNYSPLAEQFNGSEWKFQAASEPTGGQLLDVSCVSMSWCEATGTASAKEPLAEHWGGSEWLAETAATPGSGSISVLEGVSCPTTTCLAVGYAEEAGSPSAIAEIHPLQTPYVRTESPSSMSETGATLSGLVNPDGTETKYYFEYGTTPAFGSRTAEASAGSGTTSATLSASISGLSPNTFYEVRVVATNAVGTSYGKGVTFKTPPKFDLNIGSFGSGAGQLRNPQDTAVDVSGNVWVADTGNNRVAEFTSNGTFIETFGWNVNKTKVESGAAQAQRNLCTAASKDVCQAAAAGTSNGQMSNPLGIAVASGGNVWVTDSSNDRLQVFNSEGAYLSQIGKSSGALFAEPSGIAIAPNGYVWVTQRKYGSVEEFTSSGAFVREIVGPERFGSGQGAFASPEDVAVDAYGEVWVADSANHRVTHLGPNGEFVSMFGIEGSGPQGIAVEASGNPLVSTPSQVQGFNSLGRLLTRLSISNPHGIAVGAGGLIYVAGTGSSAVGKWG